MASEIEQEKRETIADIVAEMRKVKGFSVPYAPSGHNGVWLTDLIDFADRIEAAAKRVVVSKTETTTVGNAAAMREALEAIHDKVNGLDEECGVDPVEIRDLARAALSAPARNCDIYATATEAIKAQDVAFNEDNFKNGECRLGCPGCDDGLIDCKILWLFAPAERKGEGDGR